MKWDGVEEGDDDEANAEAMPGDDELIDVTKSSSNEEEQLEEQMEDPDECEHPWGNVTKEKMKRVVRGSTIDTKDIYWCGSCHTVLDVIE